MFSFTRYQVFKNDRPEKSNMNHKDETDSMFELIGRVMTLAIEDYTELQSLGLVSGQRVCKGNWPKAKTKGKRVYVQTEDKITMREAEHLISFLFKGGAKRFFWTFGLEPDVDQIVSRLIEKTKEQQQ